MSALPSRVSSDLPALLPVAAAAAAVDPRQVLDNWFASLGESARRKYRLTLRQFATWATGENDPSADLALRLLVAAGRASARGMICAWRDERLAEGKSSATVAAGCSALASCITAARLAGLVEWHVEKVAPKIEQRHDRSGPPRHEVELLVSRLDDEIEAGGRRVAYAVRDCAIVRLLHNAALRLFEVTGLRLCDVQLDHPGGARVMALRKGKREREAMLVGDLAASSLRRWLELRGATDPMAPVFCRLHAVQDLASAAAITGQAVRNMLRMRAGEAGVRAIVRPHGLRHSAATHCARNASLAALKRLGGWTTLSSPSRYMDQDDRDRRAALSVVEC